MSLCVSMRLYAFGRYAGRKVRLGLSARQAGMGCNPNTIARKWGYVCMWCDVWIGIPPYACSIEFLHAGLRDIVDAVFAPVTGNQSFIMPTNAGVIPAFHLQAFA